MSKKNPNDHTDPFSPTHMKILMKRMKKIEIGETVKRAISDWYYENGMVEPLWYVPKNPPWWDEYLNSLDNPE
jgi:hypothetical protein